MIFRKNKKEAETCSLVQFKDLLTRIVALEVEIDGFKQRRIKKIKPVDETSENKNNIYDMFLKG